jgi:hypothetical protein
VVAAAGPVDDGQLRRVGESLLEEVLKRLGRHRGIVAREYALAPWFTCASSSRPASLGAFGIS